MGFAPVDSKLFFSRQDPQDPRIGDRARSLSKIATPEDLRASLAGPGTAGDALERRFVIAGYPDDEGIRINGGRQGAALAPTEVRRSLYKMTPALYSSRPDLGTVYDIGDLKIDALIADRHSNARAFAHAALMEGANWIGIGGGHDYGFSDGAAYCDWCKHAGVRPLVINFDAHLDVRPPTNGLSSGTPFFRLLEEFPDIDFAEIGIQGHCNSRHHLAWARSRGARVLSQDEVEVSGESLLTACTRLLGDWLLRPRPVFLSIDIDGFSSSVAPGCSQSWATGFDPAEFFPLLGLLVARLQTRVLGIYEVSPPLDHDMRTAKLAAQVIHRVLS